MAPAHTGRTAEPLYRPILTAGRSDLEALRHLGSAAAALVVPILTPTATGPSDLFQRLPDGLVPAVDLAGLPDRADTFGLLRRGVPLVPVFGLADSDARLAAQGAAVRSHLWAMVRLRVRSDRWGPDAATGAVERIWRRAGLAPEQCDLLIDVGDVCCRADVRTTGPRVRRLADWALRHAWRSVTVAAGAMPPTLPGLPDHEPVPLVRWDWLLWRDLADLGLGYGDYGVSPATAGPVDQPPAGRRTADGIMRYTADGAWWIYRWSRRGGRGDDRVAALCRAVTSAPHWPGASFSWGDHEILRRARGSAGAGSASNWAAWGTSHHLAHVLAALRRPGSGWPVPSDRSGHRDRLERPGPPRGRGGRRPGWSPRGGPHRPG